MAERVTVPNIRAMKAKGEKIVAITAYDSTFAEIADESGADIVLVGDSLGNVVLGYETTVPVTLEQMEHHTAAAAKGVKRALLVADLPFGSYQSSVAQAVDSSVRLMRCGAQSVKLEGLYLDEIRAIVKAGIPVMGHLGLTPQSVHRFGGYKVQGRGKDSCRLVEAAKLIEEAGAFSLVLELIPAELAADISAQVSIPTIGIGAGVQCDGQVQVLHDVLGLNERTFKHAKTYMEGRALIAEALSRYAREVREKTFPDSEHSF